MTSLAARHKQETLARLAAEKEQAANAAPAPTPTPAPLPPMALDIEAARPAQSLAAAHRQRTLAMLASEGAAPGLAAERPADGAAATEYELLLARLGADLNRLREVQSVESKIALKGEMIAGYDEHVNATLAAAAETGTALQDEIVTTMLLWRLDIGDFARALDIAEHVLRFDLRLPERIVRNAPTLVAEEIAEAALKADKIGKPFDVPILYRAEAITSGLDKPDQVSAKLLKARARHLVSTATKMVEEGGSAPAGALAAAREEALAAFRRAFELDRNSGVKKDIERLEAALRASDPTARAPAPEGGEGQAADA